MRPVLIAYYSATGACAEMAQHIAKGVMLKGGEAVIRRIKPLGEEDITGPLYVTDEDLTSCGGMILGSPTRFGQVAACVRAFWDTTGELWYSGVMEGKPGAVFTSSSSLHGGQESTLLGMMMPMIHHGMLIMGIPYSEEAIHKTRSGGGPYGASSVTGKHYPGGMSEEEIAVCVTLGKRMALAVKKLG